jgi:osmotically-inducible protein OsmY
MNDKLLRQKVIDQLDFDPSIESAHIGVAVENGVVTLTGHVPTYLQKVSAEAAAKAVKGVLGMVEEIEVRYAGAHPHADDDIAKRAVMALAFNAMLPPDTVMVKVSRGWVTLTGELDWQYQRVAAEADVRKLHGVLGVTDSIVLKHRTVAADVERSIRDALSREAALDAEAIRVEVHGDRVTLTGDVDSWRDCELVERAAWAAPGVRVVEDHLRIV